MAKLRHCSLLAASALLAVHAQPVGAQPAAPAGLFATAGDARVELSWLDPSDASIVSWELRTGTGSPPTFGPFATVAGSGATTTTATVTGLANGARHAFEVRAVSAMGNGAAARVWVELAASPSTAVTIADPALRAAVESWLGKSAGATITQGDMARLRGLYVRGVGGVGGLSGLEHALNLQLLYASHGTITDLSPLAGLKALTTLSLSNHAIADLAPLRAVATLEFLAASGNEISDIAPLAGLTALEYLFLYDNSIADVSPLAGLPALATLSLDANSIADIAPLSTVTTLDFLSLPNNDISDISPLAGLTALEDLFLGDNSIADVSPLTGLPALDILSLTNNAVADLSPLVANAGFGAGDYLYARGNPLDAASVQTHIPTLQARGVSVAFDAPVPVAALLPDLALREAVGRAVGKAAEDLVVEDLAELRALRAAASGIRDLAGLGAAANLEQLELGGNAVTDIGELAALGRLTLLDLSDNTVVDLSALSELTGLRALLLAGNRIANLAPLAPLTALRELDLSRNAVEDLSPLSSLTSLELLWLNGNAVANVSALCPLATLRRLALADNALQDIAGISCLTGLDRLELADNEVVDLSPVAEMRSLARLDLERNRVVDLRPLRRLEELTRLRLASNRVADISPLLDNAGLGAGDVVGLRGNRLSAASMRQHLGALRAREVSVVAGLPAPWFTAAGDASQPQSFLRLANHSAAAGEALVWGVDDAGRRFGPARLAIGAGQTAHFNSHDLQAGNAAKDLHDGLGAPTEGGWRLEVLSTLDLQAMTLLRRPNGPPAAVHDTLPRFGEALRVPFLPAARGGRTTGVLRLTNPANFDASVQVWGVDDAGRGRLTSAILVPAGRAVTITAAALESGIGVGGRGLGRGEGQWRLELHVPWPVEAQTLAGGSTGPAASLSTPGVAASDEVLRVPLFPPASAPGRRGVARVANLRGVAGTVRIEAVDDAGVYAGPVTLELQPHATAEFDSRGLEEGDAGVGLAQGVGSPTRGAWRLELRSALDVRVYAYAQSTGGFATSLLDTAPEAAGNVAVAVFNPGSNQAQSSRLRLVNDGGVDATATITAVDDSGAPAGPVRVVVRGGEALSLTAAQLEAGGAGFAGALGDGRGKWRLQVASDAPLTIMSLLEDAEGRLSNVSTPGWP